MNREVVTAAAPASPIGWTLARPRFRNSIIRYADLCVWQAGALRSPAALLSMQTWPPAALLNAVHDTDGLEIVGVLVSDANAAAVDSRPC
jgi:hypothetical protein